MQPLAPAVKARFRAEGIRIPTGGAPPPQGWWPGRRTRPVPPGLMFRPKSNLEQHVLAAEVVSAGFERFVDDVCRAIAACWNAWKASATLTGVTINTGLGLLPPGGLRAGPSMTGPVLRRAMRLSGAPGSYHRYAWAVTEALSRAFATWARGYTHATIPFPTLIAPMVPQPNVPIPVAAGRSGGEALMTAGALGRSMASVLGGGNHSGALFRSIAGALASTFTSWTSSTQIVLVLGSGGVPGPTGVIGGIGVGGKLVGAPITTVDGRWSTLDWPDGVWDTSPEEARMALQDDLAELGDHDSVWERPTAPERLARWAHRIGGLEAEQQDVLLDALPGRDALRRWGDAAAEGARAALRPSVDAAAPPSSKDL